MEVDESEGRSQVSALKGSEVEDKLCVVIFAFLVVVVSAYIYQ